MSSQQSSYLTAPSRKDSSDIESEVPGPVRPVREKNIIVHEGNFVIDRPLTDTELLMGVDLRNTMNTQALLNVNLHAPKDAQQPLSTTAPPNFFTKPFDESLPTTPPKDHIIPQPTVTPPSLKKWREQHDQIHEEIQEMDSPSPEFKIDSRVSSMSIHRCMPANKFMSAAPSLHEISPARSHEEFERRSQERALETLSAERDVIIKKNEEMQERIKRVKEAQQEVMRRESAYYETSPVKSSNNLETATSAIKERKSLGFIRQTTKGGVPKDVRLTNKQLGISDKKHFKKIQDLGINIAMPFYEKHGINAKPSLTGSKSTASLAKSTENLRKSNSFGSLSSFGAASRPPLPANYQELLTNKDGNTIMHKKNVLDPEKRNQLQKCAKLFASDVKTTIVNHGRNFEEQYNHLQEQRVDQKTSFKFKLIIFLINQV